MQSLVGTYVLLGGLLATEQLPLSESGNLSTLHPPPLAINCDSHLDRYCRSPSLEQIANESVSHSAVYIDINVTQLQLNVTAYFSQLEALTINGNPNLNTTITCIATNAGLVLHDIASLTLNNIAVTHCGALIGTSKTATYSSAITILHSRDVKVKHLVVIKNMGTGMTILDHQGGFVQIKSSQFIENILPHDHPSYKKIIGGGGVYIGGFEQDPVDPVSFRFDSCTFKENVAHTRYYDHLYTDDLGQPISGHGLGGGAAVLLDGSLTDIHTIFSGCTFMKNEAFLGAGLVSEIEGVSDSETRNISVRVEDSSFQENGCSCSNPTASGGGIHISFHDAFDTFDSNKFVIHNVQFVNNCAHFGGGLYFFSYRERNTGLSNTVEIEHCTYEGNRAHTGSAVDVTPSIFQRLSTGFLVVPVFRDCNFSNNVVIPNSNGNHVQATHGIGTLYISLYSIKLEGCNVFKNNIGTAIHIVNGNIDMSLSSVNFFNNTGTQGGAVALIGESSIIVGPDRNYTFMNNTALERGGALYFQAIDNHDFTASKTCFIQYYKNIPARNWNATITFTGNKAIAGTGHAIYSTSLYPCQVISHDTLKEVQFEMVGAANTFNMRGMTIDSEEDSESSNGYQVATEGALLQFNESLSMEVIPGEEFEHGLTFVDDLGNQAEVVLAEASPKSSKVLPDTTLSPCFGKHILLKGEQNVPDMLYLKTVTSRSSYIQLNVTLTDCPPGFTFNKNASKCTCNYQGYIGIVKCDTKEFISYITPGFWAGLVEDSMDKTRTELVTSYCPLNFCNSYKSDSAVKLPKMSKDLSKSMCGESRTGVACGSCAPGYTTHFHSPNYRCKPVDPTLCKVGWLFYILSELVPVTVVFITVLVFNISFTSGAINGFILFSQLLYSFNINASGLITFPPVIATFMEGYKLFYGLFSLDFFQVEALSFCLWSNATALAMTAFKYVTIVYALLLIVLVVWFMNKCGARCLGKWWRITTVKSSLIHGISAFLILCYSQCVRISLNLLDNFSLYVRSDSNLTVSRRVWLNGDMVYFSREYVLYALPALFCLLTIGVLPPILLLAYPLFNKVLTLFGFEESRLINFVSRKVHISSLKPLLDSFQSCFKDNLRFFAGLYFIYRWSAQIIVVAPSSGYSKMYTGINALFTVILALHALCQPYARKGHNMIDALLLADLALISLITFFHLYAVRTKVSKQTAVEHVTQSAIIQLVLIYLPLLIVAVYAVVVVYRHGCRPKDKSTNTHRSTSTLSLLSKLRNLVGPVRKEGDLDSEELPHRLIAGDVDYEQF